MTMTMTTTAHTSSATLNGLDTAALAAAVGAIAADPALAPAAFSARSTWAGRFRSSTAIERYELGGACIPRRHRIDSDEPSELLGENTAPNPQDLLLAALNGCMIVGFVAGATRRGIRLESLRVQSSLCLDLRGVFGLDPTIAPGAEHIHYRIEVRGDATPERFAEIHAEVMARSPNRWHLAQPVALESTLVVL
jgi:uncharacterized OsmC-like protein